jgi:alkanesulfonate monooxygenase SsuD/methylene tetrahydromethanopterin reductase-like flavin-dependent oxidoreductase (luciferase family)
MLEEAIAIIRGLWGSAPFSFSGQHYHAVAAQVDPPVQAGGMPLVIAGGGKRTLEQLVRSGDVANFGPGPAGGVDTADDARNRIEVLNGLCRAAGRDGDEILRTHFSHWLLLAPDESALAAKVARYFPDGRDAFWGKYLVAGTPQSAAAYYQPYVDAGIEYFVAQTLDPDDVESMSLTIDELLPRLRARTRT